VVQLLLLLGWVRAAMGVQVQVQQSGSCFGDTIYRYGLHCRVRMLGVCAGLSGLERSHASQQRAQMHKAKM
jgi:hypothetical protein